MKNLELITDWPQRRYFHLSPELPDTLTPLDISKSEALITTKKEQAFKKIVVSNEKSNKAFNHFNLSKSL